jgi:hypothetical protein
MGCVPCLSSITHSNYLLGNNLCNSSKIHIKNITILDTIINSLNPPSLS